MWLIISGENLGLGSVMGLSQVCCDPGSTQASDSSLYFAGALGVVVWKAAQERAVCLQTETSEAFSQDVVGSS